MAEKIIVNEVYKKSDQNALGNPNKIGARFQDVVDTRDGQDKYTLAQFFDHYMNFMKNTTFVYEGPTKPTNSHIGLWIDTSQTNADQIGAVGSVEEEVEE